MSDLMKYVRSRPRNLNILAFSCLRQHKISDFVVREINESPFNEYQAKFL